MIHLYKSPNNNFENISYNFQNIKFWFKGRSMVFETHDVNLVNFNFFTKSHERVTFLLERQTITLNKCSTISVTSYFTTKQSENIIVTHTGYKQNSIFAFDDYIKLFR